MNSVRLFMFKSIYRVIIDITLCSKILQHRIIIMIIFTLQNNED